MKDADGNVLTTGTNDADGNVVFGDLTFDQTGTYNYTISERNDSLGGITYDGTIYTVQIDVTDAGGYLEAAVQYFEGNTKTELPEFENEYTASPTGVSLGASKILTGRDLKDGEFAFVLKDADGNTVDETVNDANGSVKFDEITYDQVGTYRYTVSEVKGDDTTITYDETVYDVTVEVTDNGIGALEPVVTIETERVRVSCLPMNTMSRRIRHRVTKIPRMIKLPIRSLTMAEQRKVQTEEMSRQATLHSLYL